MEYTGPLPASPRVTLNVSKNNDKNSPLQFICPPITTLQMNEPKHTNQARQLVSWDSLILPSQRSTIHLLKVLL